MKIFLLISGIFAIVTLGIAVDCIFSKHTIKSSCDGISSLGMEKMCDCDTPCNILQKKLDKEQRSDDQGIKVDH